ncbi:protein piccolo-like isoform 2-T2 [Liasis olivaceus]
MGNETSLEGGESLAGLPEGVAGADAGDPAGVEEDLSRLSPEERRQITAVKSRAQQGLPKGKTAGPEAPPSTRYAQPDGSDHPKQLGKPSDPGPPMLSKSRTVDTLKTEQQIPGRSTSSMSLRQSKSRTDFKDDQKPTMMPSFLSDANPFGAVTSVVNKFNPFDLISDLDTTQNEGSKKVKPTQKDHDKSEQQEGLSKQPLQLSSPKPSSPQQKAGPSKQVLQQQLQSGVPKQSQKPGSGQTTGLQSEEAKQYPGLPTFQFLQQESTKPAKPSPQQSGAETLPSVGPARTSSQTPVLTKPAAQQGVSPAKQTSQQLEDPAKAQPAAPSKQPLQHSADPPKAVPQLGGSIKQPSQQPGAKPSTQQVEPTVQFQQQAGPIKPDDQLSGPSQQQHLQHGLLATKKTFCSLCTTTELLLHIPEKANYNTCTQCQTIVCSLCGFDPNPHITEIKEWLCLNCQMQRALGDLAPVHSSGLQPSSPKQETPASVSAAKAISQPQPPMKKKETALKHDAIKSLEHKKPPTQTKQPTLPSSPAKAKALSAESKLAESTSKSGPAKPSGTDDKQKQSSVQKITSDVASKSSQLDSKQNGAKSSLTQHKMEHLQRSEANKPPQDKYVTVDKIAAPDSKTLSQVSHQKSEMKLSSQLGSGLNTKAQKQTETVGVKEYSKKIQSQMNAKQDAKLTPKSQQASMGTKPSQAQPQVQAQQPPKTPEQSRRFSLHAGGISDSPKSLPTTPQETVTGKLFGFGASIFSQASNLITTAGQPGVHVQGSASLLPSKQPLPPGQLPALQKDIPQQSPKMAPVKKEKKPPVAKKSEPSKEEDIYTSQETEKPLPSKGSKPPVVEAEKSADPPEIVQGSPPTSACPLCKTGLNVGSKDPPNYSTCTECKTVVCSLCGFNPMPHITEVSI